MLEKIFNAHNKWINTVLKFGCSQEEAEDIVGDMYCIIGKMLTKGLDISYGDDVNYYYIYLSFCLGSILIKPFLLIEWHTPAYICSEWPSELL